VLPEKAEEVIKIIANVLAALIRSIEDQEDTTARAA
jgi:hypothetical protein